GCVVCHGGDGGRPGKDEAHVRPQAAWPADERVLPQDFDADAVRFRDPGDLRVAATTCGQCHPEEVDRLGRSLHGTTAGHLSDGLYENGLLDERLSRYSIFAASAAEGFSSPHGLSRLEPIERLRVPREPDTIGDHFADLPRKACMQCHLWSQGVAVPGRLGQDGLYRGAGCSACHVSYAEDGRSQSADAAADRLAPGHPLRHELTATPPAETCLRCHVGDASIGNGFRGLAQLYPQQPAGPEIEGTTDRLIAGQFFIRDEELTPPDLHHTAGFDCIDCHTGRDAMGDGVLYGAMEHAVEIECSSCHGSFTEASALTTSRGRPLPQLSRKGDLVIQSGKRDGTSRRVKQARDVIDPEHPDYNPRAAAAMTREHEGLECYACHAGWNTNFFGFHFDRNLGFTQLDTLTGQRTRGRVTTQERVFATLRSFTLGLNSEGQVAPFLVGFSTMGTVHAEDGSLLLDQALPETAAGMSGMTMVAHQLHTTQRVARSCVECHRSPATWGLGSGDQGSSSYALARGLLLVAGERGLDTLLLDRENPEASLYLARLPLGGARRVIVDSDPVSGRASTAFVVIERAGVALVDVRNPAFPAVMAFAAAGDARDAALAGDLLVIANGTGGLRLVDVADRSRPRLVSDLVTVEARGVCVQWPRVLVADGLGGLLIADISVPEQPRVAGQVDLPAPGRPEGGDAHAVAAIFQYGHPLGPGQRTPGRLLAAVANGSFGLALVDVTEPAAAKSVLVAERYDPQSAAIDIALTRRVELGDTTGQRRTRERDIAYVLYSGPGETGRLEIVDVTEST
ncbi:MAG TPA: multiheme c-type cytochrome, partial [Planctomycetota bacterium]|nr:multiheme c-type cytochrome [Planctomycetota bacterium]